MLYRWIRKKYSGISFKIQAITIAPLAGLMSFAITQNYFSTRQAILAEKQAGIQYFVDSSIGVIEMNYREFKAGRITEEEAKSRSMAAVANIRYGKDKDDYLWINDFEKRLLVHPNAGLIGKDLSDFKDKEGKRIFIEFVNVAKAHKSGYVDYIWADKKNPDLQVPKLSYVSTFEPWNWIVGSGVYVDDVNRYVNGMLLRQVGALTAITLVILFAIAFFTRRKVSLPLVRVAGDLDQQLNSLGSSSDQIADTGQYLSASVTAQKKLLDQSSHAVDQLASLARDNALKASESNQKAMECVQMSTDGVRAVENLQASFDKIKTGNQNVMEAVSQSHESFRRIGTIIREIANKTKIINEIAFQTKLLSFNASVEAARAGEHGKGFAVVAEEVGNLANLSNHAAHEITRMLEESIGKVNAVVEETSRHVQKMIAESSSVVTSGGSDVEECATVFHKINRAISDVSILAESMAQASSEQDRGFGSIRESVHSLYEGFQQNELHSQQAEKVAHLVAEENSNLGRNISRLLEVVYGTQDQQDKKDIEILEWNERFMLQVDEMDREHKQIVVLLNALIHSLNRDDNGEMARRFDALLEFAAKHFKDEEDYMDRIGYPDLAAHKSIHQNLVKQLLEHRAKVGSPDFDETRVVSFIRNWLLSHIMGVDAKYAAHSRQGKLKLVA